MIKKIGRSAVAALVLIGAMQLAAAVRMADPFADGMVLQRDRPVPVWGTADPGEMVTVAFAGESAEALAGADGK